MRAQEIIAYILHGKNCTRGLPISRKKNQLQFYF